MQETNLNPFTSENTASAYATTDPVYRASSEAVVEFLPPIAQHIADLGAGTGISSEIILQSIKPGASFTVIEPSEAMLNIAKERLGALASYLNLAVDELPINSFDIIYALNCLHLFPDHNSASKAISKSLRANGTFVFNLSSPSYKFTELSQDELDCLYANLDFYAELHASTGAAYAVLASTVQLLTSLVTALSFQGREDEIIEGLGISASELIKRNSIGVRGLYSQEDLVNIFKAVNMDLEGYTEVVIRVPAEYQRSIWRMMAKSFINDEAMVEELLTRVMLPEEVPIRQAIFKLCKH